MALVYTEQADGTLSALEDDVLVTVRPLSDVLYAYEVWLGDEVPAYQGEARTPDEAKSRVEAWLGEALSDNNDKALRFGPPCQLVDGD